MHPVIKAKKYQTGTAKLLRKDGDIPALVYGHGRPTLNISINIQEFRKAFRVSGRSTLVEVELDATKIPALVHVIDVHPISGDPLHVDFYAVKTNEEVHAVVPVKLNGISDAVKLLGGTLTVMHSQIQIKCLPKHLISSIETSLEKLKTFHDHITVGDLAFPAEITVLDPPETIIASVAAPRKTLEEETPVQAVETASAEAAPETKEKRE